MKGTTNPQAQTHVARQKYGLLHCFQVTAPGFSELARYSLCKTKQDGPEDFSDIKLEAASLRVKPRHILPTSMHRKGQHMCLLLTTVAACLSP